jgi:hypothetical protein
MFNSRCPGTHCPGCRGGGSLAAGLATVAAGIVAGWVLLQVAGTLAALAVAGEALAALVIGGAWLLAARRPALPAPSRYAVALSRARAREVGSGPARPVSGRLLAPGEVAGLRAAGELPPARVPAQGRSAARQVAGGLAPRPGREYLSNGY